MTYQDPNGRRSVITRRRLIGALPAAALAALAGCSIEARGPELPAITPPPIVRVAPPPITPTATPAPTPTATAAAESPPQATPAIVGFASWGSPPEMLALRDALRAFRKLEPSVDVVARLDNAISPDTTRSGLRAGIAADVLRVAPEDVFDLTAAGIVLPLDDRVARDLDPSELASAVTRARTGAGGEVGALSLGAAYLAVFYNQAHIEIAGIDVPSRWDDVWDVAEFELAARRLVVANEDRVDRFGLSAVPWLARPVLADVAGTGRTGSFFSADGSTSTMHTDAHVRALRRLSAWQTVQEFELGIQERFAAPFNGGLVSLYIDASDFAPSIRPAVRWGVAPLPAWTGSEAVTEGQEFCLAIHAGSREPDAAWRLASFFLGPDAQRALARHDAVVPFRHEVLNDPAFLDPNRRPADRSVWATAFEHDLRTPANPAAKAWHVLTERRINDVRRGVVEAGTYLKGADAVLTRQLRVRGWSADTDVAGYRQPLPLGNELLARLEENDT